MPKVSILSRERTVVFTDPGQSEERVAVTYLTELFPPRTVNLVPALYRAATAEELQVNKRSAVVPKDEAGRGQERQAIRDDIAREQAQKPETFELP